MKHLAALVAVLFLLVSSSQAVSWITVTVSITVLQGGTPVTRTTLNAKKYIDRGIQRAATDFAINDANPKNYFIGYRVDTNVIQVVHIPSETVVYNVVTGVTLNGFAQKGTIASGTAAGTATISSLNTDFNGSFYDKVTPKGDGSLKGIVRTITGGSGTQTITGTIRTTAKRYEL